MFKHITKTSFRAKPACFSPARMSTLAATAPTSVSSSPARTKWLPPSPGSNFPLAYISPALLASVAQEAKANSLLCHRARDHIILRTIEKSALRNAFTPLTRLATELCQLKAFQQKHEPALQQLREIREFVERVKKT